MSTDLPLTQTRPVILASQSAIRSQLLTRAGLAHTALPARVDEDGIRDALLAEGAHPRDLADTLAEMKARKLAERHPDHVVIGCDQVLALGARVFSKPTTPVEARDHLRALSGQTHQLLSAVVVYDRAQPVWRHLARVDMTMRPLSDPWLDGYVARNWPGLSHSVGAYKLEEEGVQLFTAIGGDYFAILGLPILPLIGYFQTRGWLLT